VATGAVVGPDIDEVQGGGWTQQWEAAQRGGGGIARVVNGR
jgi:hypothetical protein